MSVLSEIFSPSFFMILAVVFILLALLVIYFESKMREQNHKIASMLSLVSSLAEEINVLRFNFITFASNNNLNTNKTLPENNENNQLENNLIAVSDDEDDDEEEDEDEEDENEDDEDGEEDEEDGDDDEEDENDNELNEVIEIGDIKVLKINMESYEKKIPLEDLEEENDLAEFDVESVSDLEISNHLEEDNTIMESNPLDLKSIPISNLEETKQDENLIDYKKISLQKLRTIVSEKGLISDASKLKKHELLALLGVV